MNNKQLAELQFDKSAAPISLGFQFNNSFEDYQFDTDSIDDVEEYHVYDPPHLVSNEIECFECDPRSLVLLANDLLPDKRDKLEIQQPDPIIIDTPIADQSSEPDQPKDDQFFLFHDDNQDDQHKQQFENLSVKSVDFLIANQKFREEHIEDKAKFGNKAVSAFNLVLLAIEKLNLFERHKLKIEKDTTDKVHNFSTMLIDKSTSSIKFINKIGLRLQNQISNNNPNKFTKLKDDKSTDINYLNTHVAKTRLDHLYHYAILAKYVNFSHVELNSMPAFDLGLKHNHLMISCHSLLRYLNFSTIHANSITFRNVKNLVASFPDRYSSKRLFYLEYLISEVENGNLFFNSNHVNFFDRPDNRWNNSAFPGINKWINHWYNTIQL